MAASQSHCRPLMSNARPHANAAPIRSRHLVLPARQLCGCAPWRASGKLRRGDGSGGPLAAFEALVPPMPGLLIDKLCNPFLREAAPTGLLPEAVLGAVRHVRKRTGGLWVGGRVKA
jgi:hypothetical protein